MCAETHISIKLRRLRLPEASYRVSRGARILFVALVIALYVALFLALFRFFGHGVAVGALLPVVIAGAILGVRGALVAGASCAALTSGLYCVVGHAPDEAILRGVAGSATFAAVGALVGWLRELVIALQAEQHKLEEALRRETDAQQRLARSEALLAHAERAAGIGSWETDLATGQSRWSAGSHAVLGLIPSDDPKTLDDFLAIVHPADRARVKSMAGRALRTRQGYTIEHRIMRADGAVRVLLSRLDFVTDPDGTERLIGTGQDITERRELEARLRLADRMASLGTLAGGVAHEINNPLAFVSANVEFSKAELARAARAARPVNVPAVAEALDEALDGARRIRSIVSDLRTFARADDERHEAVDVNRALDSAIALAGNEIRHRARLVKEYGAAGHALANESRLAQLFVNLLVNGAQAIPEGHAAEHVVRVRSYREGDAVHVEISDTGCGIAPELRGRVFDPFFSTKPVGAGLGLGLSICHGIVQRFGGQIALVDSEVGKGSTFRVSLKVASPVDARAEAAAGGPPEPAAPRRGRVLIVDDEEHVLSALGRLLRSEHDVTLAPNAIEALEKIGAETYDVILCDLMMPQMSGMDLFTAVSGVAAAQAERFVFMTGGAFTPRARDFLETVGKAALEKPVPRDVLLGAIRERLQRAG